MNIPTHYDTGERIGSWILITPERIREVYNHYNATLFHNTSNCVVIPIRTYLEDLNRAIKDGINTDDHIASLRERIEP